MFYMQIRWFEHRSIGNGSFAELLNKSKYHRTGIDGRIFKTREKFNTDDIP